LHPCLSVLQACLGKSRRGMHGSLHWNVGFELRPVCRDGCIAGPRECFSTPAGRRDSRPALLVDYYEHAGVRMQDAVMQSTTRMQLAAVPTPRRGKVPKTFYRYAHAAAPQVFCSACSYALGKHAGLSVCHRPTHSSFPPQTLRRASLQIRCTPPNMTGTTLSVQCTISHEYTLPGNP